MAIDPIYEDDLASVMELDHIYCSDNLSVLQTFPDNSIDALVCDPPAGIGFMGKAWDDFTKNARPGQNSNGFFNHSGNARLGIRVSDYDRKSFIAFMTPILEECLRVMKPGAHGFVWALPRTSHWTMCALEDAGFEIRDMVTHIFGTGMPKSHNISLNIDKSKGAERKIVSTHKTKDIRRNVEEDRKIGLTSGQPKFGTGSPSVTMDYKVTAPATPEAEQWNGWGSSMKPSTEFWILVRKPLAEKTIVAQVLATGTGAINIDACRTAGIVRQTTQGASSKIYGGGKGFAPEGRQLSQPHDDGRWPAHLVLSHSEGCTPTTCHNECPIAILDTQGGVRTSGKSDGFEGPYKAEVYGKYEKNLIRPETIYGDTGGASRYFSQFSYEKIPKFIYMPKASPGDRTSGKIVKNDHPTVKPTALMAWLCKLITPPNGTVLDPFVGSGSTLVGAVREGFHYIGIDMDAHYCEIAEARVREERKKRG
jgi:DNA modification methylase